MLRLKYGGSGDIKTPVLERAQKTIIQCRTASVTLTIDSNMIMSMINEILAKRAKANEFIIESTTSLDIEDSKFEIYFEAESNIVDADLYEEHLRAWQQSQIEIPVHPSQVEEFKKLCFAQIAKNKNIDVGFINEFSLSYSKHISNGINIPSERVEIKEMSGQGLYRFDFAFLKSEVKEELANELFALANKFAVNKQGEVAVRLHIIYNSL